jgi:hypothetical protein
LDKSRLLHEQLEVVLWLTLIVAVGVVVVAVLLF